MSRESVGIACRTNRKSLQAMLMAGLGLSLLFVASSVSAQLPPTPAPNQEALEPEPDIYAAERYKSLGEVIEGDVVTVTWIIENHGKADLVINRIGAACGCTVVQLADEERVVPPDGLLEIVADFDSKKRRGSQRKGVTVYNNDPDEPEFKLEFTAEVAPVFELNPANTLNLRMLRRGDENLKGIDVIPVPGRGDIEAVAVSLADDAPLDWEVEPLDAPGNAKGRRIRFSVSPEAAMGVIATAANVRVKVDGIERERTVRVRGEVVGDLIWQPQVVDSTRLRLARGMKLIPVSLRSTDDAPFDVLRVEADAPLQVSVEPIDAHSPRTGYQITSRIADDAEEGPFGAALKIYTTLVDQPVITVPVYGQVAPIVEVEPPVVLLRADGTPVGTKRRLKLQADPREHLGITAIDCDVEGISVSLDHQANEPYLHLRWFNVVLESAPAAEREGEIVISTNVAGAETLRIPLRISTP